jgi:hypothetical protein
LKKVDWFSIFVTTALLTFSVKTEAQQTGKIFRIGFLDPGTASGMAVMVDGFRQELSKHGWIEGKNTPSSTDLPRTKAKIACLSLQRSWFVSRLT